MRHHRGCSNSHTCIHLIILEIPHASTAGLAAGTGQLPQGIKCTNTFTVQAPAIPRDPISLHGRTHCRNRSQLPQGTKCTNTCTAQAPAIPRDPTRLHGRTPSRNGSRSPRGQSTDTSKLRELKRQNSPQEKVAECAHTQSQAHAQGLPAE
jgi:hypothetical protein